MDYGLWTLVPPFIVIALAIWSKKPIESLLLGCVSAYAIIAMKTGQDFLQISKEALFKVATDYDNIHIIFICGLLGSLIALLNASNGTHAIARTIGKYCKSERSVLLSAWVLGIIIFIDDYMNVMTVSSCMNRICDEKKIPRATLAYIIDSTGAPICVLVPFSTWAIFYASNFYDQPAVRALGFNSAMSAYVHCVPFMFYAIIAVIIVPLVICGIVPIIGPLKREYEAMVSSEQGDEEGNETKGHIIDFIIPIAVMILVTIILDDMFWALVASIISCIILFIPRKIISFEQFTELWIKGFCDLMPTLVVLLFAFFMKQACADINLPVFVVDKCLPYVSAKTFPVIAFVIVCILAFVTGDSWGVPAICVPIIIPLASACSANILLTMAAIVSGGAFCSHSCFYSDTTVLTATCCEMDCMVHAKTQFPYALMAFGASVVLYTVMGFIL